MYVLVLLLVLERCVASFWESISMIYPRERSGKVLNLNQTVFSILDNNESGATRVPEAEYVWAARVVLSRSHYTPHMCTAVCVHERIFISASRCIYDLRLNHTSVIYMQQWLHAIAFVHPSRPTQQAYDDIGFIIVERGHFGGQWKTIKLFDEIRTDDAFEWFQNMDFSMGVKVVGYAFPKGNQNRFRDYNLCKLNVVVDMQLCVKLYTLNVIEGFQVPCYHSCNITQFDMKSDVCKKYLGAEGSAIIDLKTNKLLGVATWGAKDAAANYDLPVGFAVPNSQNFFEDYACAIKIMNDKERSPSAGYYQKLCDTGGMM